MAKSYQERAAAARVMVDHLVVGSTRTKEIVDAVSSKCGVGRACVNDMVTSARKKAGIHRPLPKSRKHETNFATKAKVEVNVPATVEASDV